MTYQLSPVFAVELILSLCAISPLIILCLVFVPTYLNLKKFQSQILFPRSFWYAGTIRHYSFRVAQQMFGNLKTKLAILFCVTTNNNFVIWISFNVTQHTETVQNICKKVKIQIFFKSCPFYFFSDVPIWITILILHYFWNMYSFHVLVRIIFFVNIAIMKFVLSKIITLLTIFRDFFLNVSLHHFMFSDIRVTLNDTQM